MQSTKLERFLEENKKVLYSYHFFCMPFKEFLGKFDSPYMYNKIDEFDKEIPFGIWL